MSFSFLRIITMEILYETLSPLAGETSTPPPPPSSSPEIEPYVVLRNHISLSTIQCPSPESAAPDYFSLDVNEAEDNGTLISATPPPSRDAAPSPDRKFEGSWFHSNSRFRSPMLRLHKGVSFFASAELVLPFIAYCSPELALSSCDSDF